MEVVVGFDYSGGFCCGLGFFFKLSLQKYFFLFDSEHLAGKQLFLNEEMEE